MIRMMNIVGNWTTGHVGLVDMYLDLEIAEDN